MQLNLEMPSQKTSPDGSVLQITPSDVSWPDLSGQMIPCSVQVAESGPTRAWLPGHSAGRVLDAQYFGLAQRRRRVIVVADFGEGADPAAVLFERKSLRWNTATRRKAGEGIAPTISARTKGGGGLGTDFDLDGGLINYAPEIARCVATREGSSQDYESTTMVATSFAKQSSFADARQDDFCGTLIKGHTPEVAYGSPLDTTGHQGDKVVGGGDIWPCLAAQNANNGGGAGALLHATTYSAVRRLTPRECERLQGFPDDYTLIPWRRKPAEESPDGPRYKALGNSWAVPKFRWVGEQIARFMPVNDNKEQTNAAA